MACLNPENQKDSSDDIIKRLKNRFLIDIVEDIFGYLDAKSLRNAERVSKAWREVVSDSNRKLWKNLLLAKISSSVVWGKLFSCFRLDFHLSMDDLYYFRKLYNMIEFSNSKLNENWDIPSFTTDFIECGSGVSMAYNLSENFIGLWERTSGLFRIWNRKSLKLVEVHKGVDGIDCGFCGNFQLHQDAMVYAFSDQIVTLNLISKKITTYKLDGEHKGKVVVHLLAQNGFLCALVGFLNGTSERDVVVWKMKEGLVEWNDEYHVPTSVIVDSLSIFVDSNNLVLLNHFAPLKTRAQVFSTGESFRKINDFKIKLHHRFSHILYQDGYLVVSNSDDEEGEISLINIKSGVRGRVIKHYVDFSDGNSSLRLNSKYLAICNSNFGSNCRIQVWNFKQLCAASTCSSLFVEPFCIFNAFLDLPDFFHFDDFGIVAVMRKVELQDNAFSGKNFYSFHVIDFLPKCTACKIISKQLMRCSQCKLAKYCSPSCQRSNWLHHRDLCLDYAQLVRKEESESD